MFAMGWRLVGNLFVFWYRPIECVCVFSRDYLDVTIGWGFVIEWS
jgi:hypothetical protein